MNCSYSVVIRTLGNTGEKYKVLIDSILSQTIQPEEIIVVLPHGNSLDYYTGKERIVYCERGMVTQRAVGIQEAKSDYILVADDDLQFGPTMIEDLFLYMQMNNLDCCLPMQGIDENNSDTIDLRYPLLTRIRCGFTGQMLTSRRKSQYLDVLTYTAGHKIYLNSNKVDNCYLCTTACFQLFFIKTKVAQSAHFENETWLQEGSMTSYSSFDEPVFFSILNQKEFRMAYALRVRYIHLDAKVGHSTRTRVEEKSIRYFSIARNRTIYWYKFIWKPAKSFRKKCLALLGGIYGTFNYTLLTILVNLRPKEIHSLKALFKGYHEAWKYIKQI